MMLLFLHCFLSHSQQRTVYGSMNKHMLKCICLTIETKCICLTIETKLEDVLRLEKPKISVKTK